MAKIELKSDFTPIRDQKTAIDSIVQNIKDNVKYQTLLGVTGSGKTFSVANIIDKLNMPTLIISHNKTLAGQLYQEFRDFFPDNAVSYFVSYYDYYQPEAYIPQTDTYIEKDADINELIDKLRLATTMNLLTRKDVVVVASVSCIYNIGSPREYGNYILDLMPGLPTTRDQIVNRLIDLQYERADFGFHRGSFRVRGDIISVYPAYQDEAIEIELPGKQIEKLRITNPITGEIIKDSDQTKRAVIYPAKHFITDPNKSEDVYKRIAKDLKEQTDKLIKMGKQLEAHRLKQKVTYDMEMIRQVGYVKGIENYSRYFDGRNPGDPPFSLLEYFWEAYGDNWLLVVDESHISFPQIRGMFAGDLARKQTLIEYGFRLPSALDNRPLQFDEFMRKIPRFLAVSATPSQWEKDLSESHIVEQLLRPTGIPDPEVTIRPTNTQVADVIKEVKIRAKRGERTLITTLTKRTAEDLSEFMKTEGLNVHYLHSDVATLERGDILDQLRMGKFDALVGINLLREGLDLPEVSLVAILDADKEGFLRSDVTLIQTMGRAARHIKGEVILYADKTTGSMQRALDEVRRRRAYQIEANKRDGITPTPITKPIRQRLINVDPEAIDPTSMPDVDLESLTPTDKKRLARRLRTEMRLAAQDLNFELAAQLRDKIRQLE
jgi:excinuclease ABC subunit B